MYCRLDEWQLSRDAYYSTISDTDLDDLVREIKIQENPNIGEVMLMAALKFGFSALTHTQQSYEEEIQESVLSRWSKQLMAHRWESQDDQMEDSNSWGN